MTFREVTNHPVFWSLWTVFSILLVGLVAINYWLFLVPIGLNVGLLILQLIDMCK